MDLLNIDFEPFCKDIIDAYSEVYGSKYHSIIADKINKSCMFHYNDYPGLKRYINSLKDIKKDDFILKFLDEIGIDINIFKKEKILDKLADEAMGIIGNIIGYKWQFLEDEEDHILKIRTFRSDKDSSVITGKKVELINYLRGDDLEPITIDTLDELTHTEEYQQLKLKVDKYNEIYDRLLVEYNNWCGQFQKYQDYIDKESTRQKEIMKQKGMEVIDKIYLQMPEKIQQSMDKLDENLKWTMFFSTFSDYDFSDCSIIDYFNQENMDKLTSHDVELINKWVIVSNQTRYFERLGLPLPDKSILKCDKEEDVQKYLEFLNQKDIQQYIPSKEIIDEFHSISETLYEEALVEYYTNREDFKELYSHFDNKDHNKDHLYQIFKEKSVCVFYATGNIYDFSTMTFTIRGNDVGCLDFSFIHECGHIIDNTSSYCGFDRHESDSKNPYMDKYRKYERFNETLTDIFALEVQEVLKRKGINMIDAKGMEDPNLHDFNTANIVKNILRPLLDNYRDIVIEAKINSNPRILIDWIGKDNYETLVDILNKVDYLCQNGLMDKLKENKNDELVQDYNEQMEHVKKVYKDIDRYFTYINIEFMTRKAI